MTFFQIQKDNTNLYEMFHVREYLTRRAYKHETGMAINIMVVEALAKAEPYNNFINFIGNTFGFFNF